MDLRPNGSLAALWMSRLDPEDAAAAEGAEIAALLTAAVAGDAAAFERIVLRYERRVLTLALRLLGDLSDAQDAAQETFIRAFKYLHRFDARRPFEPWLVRMAVNVCRDMSSRRQKSRVLFSEHDASNADFPDRAAPDPFSALDAEQQRAMVHAALDILPEKERAAIILRDIEGFSTAEVADALGSSEATVRAQISSARVKIKKAIERMKGGRR